MLIYYTKYSINNNNNMQHFVQFAEAPSLGANFNLKAGTDALKQVGGRLAGLNTVKIGSGVGAAAGLAKGAGIGESEEDKAKTSGLGRVGKILGNTAAGGVVGGSLGLSGGDVAKGLKRQYKKSNISNNAYGYGASAEFGFEKFMSGAKALNDRAYNYSLANPTKILAGAGALGGAIQGSGVTESEEERAKTSGIGRLGKVVSNAAIGGVIGTGIGTVSKKAEQLGTGLVNKYSRAGSFGDSMSNQVPDFSKL